MLLECDKLRRRNSPNNLRRAHGGFPEIIQIWLVSSVLVRLVYDKNRVKADSPESTQFTCVGDNKEPPVIATDSTILNDSLIPPLIWIRTHYAEAPLNGWRKNCVY